MISNRGEELALDVAEEDSVQAITLPEEIPNEVSCKERHTATQGQHISVSIDGTVHEGAMQKTDAAKDTKEDPIEKMAAKLHKKFRVGPQRTYQPRVDEKTHAYTRKIDTGTTMLDYSKLFSYFGTKTATDVYREHYTSDAAPQARSDQDSLTWQQFDDVVRKGIYNKMGFMDYINPYEKEKADLVSKGLDVIMQMTRQILAGTVRVG